MRIDWVDHPRTVDRLCPVGDTPGAKQVRLAVDAPGVGRPGLHLLDCAACGSAFYDDLRTPAYEAVYYGPEFLKYYLELGAGLDTMIEPLCRVDPTRVRTYLETAAVSASLSFRPLRVRVGGPRAGPIALRRGGPRSSGPRYRNSLPRPGRAGSAISVMLASVFTADGETEDLMCQARILSLFCLVWVAPAAAVAEFLELSAPPLTSLASDRAWRMPGPLIEATRQALLPGKAATLSLRLNGLFRRS